MLDTVGVIAWEADSGGTVALNVTVELDTVARDRVEENTTAEPLRLWLIVEARWCELSIFDDAEYAFDEIDGLFLEAHGDIVTERTERIEGDPVCTITDVSVVKGVYPLTEVSQFVEVADDVGITLDNVIPERRLE